MALRPVLRRPLLDALVTPWARATAALTGCAGLTDLTVAVVLTGALSAALTACDATAELGRAGVARATEAASRLSSEAAIGPVT